jgi:long-subunit fatty acid transport protein
MKRFSSAIVAICFILVFVLSVQAQNRYDVLRYVSTQPSIDAVTTMYGGATTALPTGLGAASDNPAVLGMVKKSSFNVGFNNRRIQEQAFFLSSDDYLSQGTTSLSDIGFIYKAPTLRGSMVFGATYNKSTDFLRGYQVYGYNSESTVTDGFSSTSSQYYDLAYRKAYFDLDDGDYSIFRLAPYAGINQDVQQTEKGQLGELNFFGAVETAPNLFVGASLSVPFGFYRYQRFFLEEDTKGLYFGEFFVQYPNGDKYFDDVRDVFLLDEINASITGVYGRLGMAYKVQPWLNVGLSYRTPTNLTIREDYLSSLEINFDNGDFIGPEQLEGKVTYKVKNPGRLSLGVAVQDFNGLTLSGSTEFVPYSKSEINFKNPTASDIGYQRDENRQIRSEFQDVWNVKVGLGYRLGAIEPAIGYSLYPAVSRDFGDDIATYSAGVKIRGNEDFSFNVAATYSEFSDTQTMYKGISSPANVGLDIKKIQVTAGLVFRF